MEKQPRKSTIITLTDDDAADLQRMFKKSEKLNKDIPEKPYRGKSHIVREEKPSKSKS